MTVQYGAALPITEIKAAGDAWEVEGWCSTFGNLDLVGDVVIKGAFDETLASGNKVRFLRSHRDELMLGVPIELRVDDKGLWGKFRISKTQLGAETHELLKDAALDSFSIGYIPTDIAYDDMGNRLLKSVELLEVSVVSIPANPEATVTGVKEKPLVDVDVKFPEYVKQIVDVLEQCATKAGALVERRAEEERELSEANLEAIKSLIGTAGAVSERLEGFIAPPVVEETPPPAPALTSPSASKLRLEITRKRLERLGILERSA